jgi:RNA polymerase sigma factor (sigma-70 family)
MEIPSTTVDLRSTIEAAAGGDLDAFTRIVIRFQDAVYAHVYSRLRDTGRTEDAVQEVFIDAFRHLAELREPAAFTAWLRRIVAKHCDRAVRRREHQHVPLPEEMDLAGPSNDPGEALDRAIACDRVRKAVDSLPAGERLVVLHTYLAEQSAAEAAAFLGLPLTTVKKRLYTARRRLADQLGDLIEDAFHQQRPSQRPIFSARIELFLALRAGDVARVERLLDTHPGLLDAEENWEVDDQIADAVPFPLRATPLIRAAEQGNRLLVRRLLKRGADPNRRCGCLVNESPLFAATVTARPEIVADLLDAGADIEVSTAGGIRPLHVAAMRGDDGLVHMLLERGADAAARDHLGRTAADWARLRGWHDLARTVCSSSPPGGSTHTQAAAKDEQRQSADRLFGAVLDPTGHIETAPGRRSPAAAALRSTPDPSPAERGFWETGIKAVDLFAPLPYGGCVEVRGARRHTGVMVLLLELVQRAGRAVMVGWEHLGYERMDTLTALRETATLEKTIVIYAQRADTPARRGRAWQTAAQLASEVARDGGHLVVVALEPDPAIQPQIVPGASITVLVALPPKPNGSAQEGSDTKVDVHLSLSPRLAAAHLFPAVDVVESRSRLLAPEIVGDRHCRLAAQARDLLARSGDGITGFRIPGGNDCEVVARGQRLRAYLTQPFSCSEAFSGRPGVSIDRQQMLDDVEAILDGRWDHVAPEQLFYAPAQFAADRSAG